MPDEQGFRVQREEFAGDAPAVAPPLAGGPVTTAMVVRQICEFHSDVTSLRTELSAISQSLADGQARTVERLGVLIESARAQEQVIDRLDTLIEIAREQVETMRLLGWQGRILGESTSEVADTLRERIAQIEAVRAEAGGDDAATE